MAAAMSKLLLGGIEIPHAVEFEGSIIHVFDPVHHHPLPVPAADSDSELDQRLRHDDRWVHCRRPIVTVGGELELEHLDLIFTPGMGFYRAPMQMKANGGMLLIDDFGRQRCSPQALLNRWIVPLETGHDHLTLQTGQTIIVPFSVFVVFATNIKPGDLVDEAFLRRIHFKVFAQSPTIEEFMQIFENCCRERNIPFERTVVEDLLERYYRPRQISLRGCHPRDLLNHVVSLAEYSERPRVLTSEMLDAACASSAIRATGGTAIVDSVKRISSLLAGVEGRHAILLITDGYDEHSTESVDQAVAAVKSAHATLYVIGVGGVAGISLRGAQLLRKLAEDSGGRAFFPARPSQLSLIHELVSSDVFDRYLITYTPLDQTPDGMWRAISLVTDDKDHKVRTRAGHMAPAPPPVRPSLEFTITDLERRHLDVSAEELVVVEDGVPQTIDVFNEAVDPVSIILALDSSGSMKRSVDAVMEAARTFVHAVRDEDSLAVVMFADRPVFAHDLTTTRDWSLEAIDDYTPIGGTALYDTVVDSLTRLRRVEGRKVIVLLTDGRDEAGERYARKDASMGGRRHGSNPGTVGLAGQRVPIRVPRLRRIAGSEIPLRSYAALHGEGALHDRRRAGERTARGAG